MCVPVDRNTPLIIAVHVMYVLCDRSFPGKNGVCLKLGVGAPVPLRLLSV